MASGNDGAHFKTSLSTPRSQSEFESDSGSEVGAVAVVVSVSVDDARSQLGSCMARL